MKQDKLWSGRFNKNVAKLVESFTQSISFDKRLAKYDVKGSIAHVQMLQKCKIISKTDGSKILVGLNKILNLIKENKFPYNEKLEDIHMNIESVLINLIGETGKKLHTARSRNDQVLVDVYLYLKDIISEIKTLIVNFQKVLIQCAESNLNTIIPGYTHLQQAQPILVSHYFMAFFFKLQRDKERFERVIKQVNQLPLGVGALAGVNYPTDRKYLAKLLNFSNVTENSLDTVSNRDFMVEFILNCALTATHLSNLAEDLIIWNTEEYKFIEIDDSFTTGSSIMPNKKNPDVLELIRGKTAHLIGYLNSIIILLKGLPLTYNRDLQEDKIILFNSIDILIPILTIIPELLKNIKFNTTEIEKKLASGFMLATDLADYLVKQNVPFRQAHKIIGQLINYCSTNEKSLFSLSIDEFKKIYKNFDQNIYALLNYKKSIQSKLSYGSTSLTSVKHQIKIAKKML